MKKLSYLMLLFGFIFFFSCERVDDDNGDEFESEGEITGVDLTLCACCGGLQIKFEEREEIFLFEELPPNSNVDISSQAFPIKVRADWTEGISKFCPLDISIERIEVSE